MSDAPWLATAFEAIDAANAEDPNAIPTHDGTGPKELVHGRRASDWLAELAPDASPALRLAVRSHHIERWKRPRRDYETGRVGYLRWRKDAQRFHAERMCELAAAAGAPPDVLDRAAALVRKERPADDVHRAEAQAFEDALCLVFVERQLADFAETVTAAKLRDILAKTLPKMSDDAVARAAALPLAEDHRALLLEVASEVR